MTDVLVRNLQEKTHRELKRRAKTHGWSINAEICATLDKAAQPVKPFGLGTEIHEFCKEYAKELAEIDFETLRDKSPATYPDFMSPEFDRPEFE